MAQDVIQVEDIGKLYRLGEVGTGTLSNDLNRWWAKLRGREDPFSKMGQVNDRTRKDRTAHDLVWALRHIDFSVQQGEVVGIIGRNGAGKSTLLKIISRITTPSEGAIRLKGRVASLLEVGTGFHPEMTGRENVFMNGTLLGMTRKMIQSKLDEILDFAGVTLYVDTPVKRYSSGMQVRLAFAVAAFLEPEILVVDEVLAVGDAEFQAKATGKMQDVSRQQGRTVLFVSHNMGSVSKLCTRCVTLKNGGVNFVGPTQEAIARYAGDVTVDSSVEFNHPIVKSLSVAVQDGALVLLLHYQSAGARPISVGYVVADQLGNKIFGANPKHLSQALPPSAPENGTVRTEISMPKLREGIYRISLWIGDGYSDFFSAEDCLAIRIDDMISLEIKANSSAVGPVIPQTKWSYESR